VNCTIFTEKNIVFIEMPASTRYKSVKCIPIFINVSELCIFVFMILLIFSVEQKNA